MAETDIPKKESGSALVPNLRFPEFRGAEEWKSAPLSDLIRSLDAGVSVNSGDRPATDYEIGILKTSSVTNGIFEPLENKVVFDEGEKERVKEPVQGGTIIISRMNTPALVGANAYVERSIQNVFLPDRLWAAKPRKDVSMRFIASILGSARSRSALSKIAKGSSDTMKNISKADVLAFRIQSPSPAEQEKIADCLSSLDELIAVQAQKVEALKSHKKGLMQQLFPREGETRPRFRFPGFSDAGVWVPEALENLTSAKISYGIVQAGPHVSDGMPYIKSTDLNSELCLAKLARTSDVIAHKYRRSEVLPGDIVFSLRGNIGIAQIVPDAIPVANLTQGTARIRTIKSPEFYFYALQSPSVRNQILATAKGSTFQEISLQALRDIRLFHPELAEQQRVACCLSNLDALLTAETQKLESLKTHKKGLMQQLFPSTWGDEL
jgi:type I restriction enzyme S subunit